MRQRARGRLPNGKGAGAGSSAQRGLSGVGWLGQNLYERIEAGAIQANNPKNNNNKSERNKTQNNNN